MQEQRRADTRRFRLLINVVTTSWSLEGRHELNMFKKIILKLAKDGTCFNHKKTRRHSKTKTGRKAYGRPEVCYGKIEEDERMEKNRK